MSTQAKERTIYEGAGELLTELRTAGRVKYDVGVVDKRLTERWEGVGVGEEAAEFNFVSTVVARPQKTTKSTQRVEVLASVQLSDLMKLESNVTSLESALRGVSYASSTILEMEKFLGAFDENQQNVRRALDSVDSKVEALHEQCRRNLGAAMDAELAMNMCRKMEVLAAIAPAVAGAKANIEALEAVAGEWEEVKRGAEMVVKNVEEHEQTLDQVESNLQELEAQLEAAEKSVAQTFDGFERELLITAKRYL